MIANFHRNVGIHCSRHEFSTIGSCPHDTESIFKTKQMAESTLKVKMNNTSLEAIKIIGPWAYLNKQLPRRWNSVECASRISHKKSHIQNSHVKTGLTVCGVATLFTWDSTLTFSFLVASIRTPATWLIVLVSFTSNSTICAMTASFSWNRINTKTRPCRMVCICNISGEAAGEIWSLLLLGMKGSSLVPSHQRGGGAKWAHVDFEMRWFFFEDSRSDPKLV